MRGLSESTRVLITLANAILQNDHPQTLRQIHYRLVSLSLDGYANDKSSYRSLCRILTNARRRHRAWELDYSDGCPENPPALSIPSNSIVDELRKGERVSVWENAQAYIEIVRDSYRRDNWVLAIHAGDIKAFNLPPQKLKDTDTRAGAFRREFGNNAATVELEALPVTELKQRIAGAIAYLIDRERWDHQTMVQDVELASIAEFADRMKNLPQLGGEA